MKNIRILYLKIFIFWRWNFQCILNRHVFLMLKENKRHLIKSHVQFTTYGYVRNCWMSCTTVDLDQALHSAASDLDLHCLLRPVCPETYRPYTVFWSNWTLHKFWTSIKWFRFYPQMLVARVTPKIHTSLPHSLPTPGLELSQVLS